MKIHHIGEWLDKDYDAHEGEGFYIGSSKGLKEGEKKARVARFITKIVGWPSWIWSLTETPKAAEEQGDFVFVMIKNCRKSSNLIETRKVVSC